MDINSNHYQVQNLDSIDSPALLVFRKKVQDNIRQTIAMAGSPDRLTPHLKTAKMAAVVQMYLEAGIQRFKCATIAEAEMAAGCNPSEVILAYQPVGPKLNRFFRLMDSFSWVKFAALVDDPGVLERMETGARKNDQPVRLFLDLDCGMGRTGVRPGEAAKALYRRLTESPVLDVQGIHAYDGHIRQAGLHDRQQASDEAFAAVLAFKSELEAEGLPVKRLITSGSPTFPTHLAKQGIELSPGTTVFWDAGYGSRFADLNFEPAALVLTRVISKPGSHSLCLDLGHKSIASENPIEKRVHFLGLTVDRYLIHSEEHLVVETAQADEYEVGDAILGIPWHICPTVALHQEAIVIEQEMAVGNWPVVARDRRIVI
jgi:D-serine deaminase-like pyridoxal phosphate-dependent protein